MQRDFKNATQDEFLYLITCSASKYQNSLIGMTNEAYSKVEFGVNGQDKIAKCVNFYKCRSSIIYMISDDQATLSFKETIALSQ